MVELVQKTVSLLELSLSLLVIILFLLAMAPLVLVLISSVLIISSLRHLLNLRFAIFKASEESLEEVTEKIKQLFTIL
jgi:hypothetical protein